MGEIHKGERVLHVNDEFTIGPVAFPAVVRFEVEATAPIDPVVRSQQEQVPRLRQRIAELEAQLEADDGRIADRILNAVSDALSKRLPS